MQNISNLANFVPGLLKEQRFPIDGLQAPERPQNIIIVILFVIIDAQTGLRRFVVIEQGKYPLIPTLWMIFEDSTFAFRSGDKHRSRRIYGK